MRYVAVKSLAVLIIFSLFSFDVSAVGLQEYLQNAGTETEAFTQTSPPSAVENTTNQSNNQLIHIIELVVAGIVASALIISVLVLFFGRWLARREKKIIKELRLNAENDKQDITSAATTIREQEKETTKLTHDMRNQATEFSTQQKVTKKYSEEIIAAGEKIREQQLDIDTVSNNVSESMNKIQSYWDEQLIDTVSTINLVQENLSNNLNVVDDDLEKMEQQKIIAQELLQEFLDKHNEQINVLENNSEMSQKVSDNLEQAYQESNSLIEILKKQQKDAEQSLKHYTNKLNNYEEQAYEQFDTSFQVADLARQELTANMEENRKHIETIRRQEEQSHNINSQTMKNLESLDFSKIVKISNTLDSTQTMFDEIHSKVGETRHMLEELREIETDIKQTASNVDNSVNGQIEELIEAEIEKVGVLETVQADVEGAPDIENEKITEAEVEEAAELEVEEATQFELEKGNEPSEEPQPTIVHKDNTTIEISDYKMASGDSTPLSFFRNMNKKEK